jgi:uncharacterized membrane protein (GlpM family)
MQLAAQQKVDFSRFVLGGATASAVSGIVWGAIFTFFVLVSPMTSWGASPVSLNELPKLLPSLMHGSLVGSLAGFMVGGAVSAILGHSILLVSQNFARFRTTLAILIWAAISYVLYLLAWEIAKHLLPLGQATFWFMKLLDHEYWLIQDLELDDAIDSSILLSSIAAAITFFSIWNWIVLAKLTTKLESRASTFKGETP